MSKLILIQTTKNSTSKAPLYYPLFSLLFIYIFSTVGFFLQLIFITHPVYAEEDYLKSVSHRKLSDIERGNISTGCVSIQASLKNLQKNDSKTRVLLGTSYQTLLSNFISPLNIRLVKNNLPDPLLAKNQSDLLLFRNNFTSLFVIYSQHLESLISFDCKNNPDDFYVELENVRVLRNELEKSITEINAIISVHLKAVNQLKNNLNNKQSNQNSVNDPNNINKSLGSDWQ